MTRTKQNKRPSNKPEPYNPPSTAPIKKTHRELSHPSSARKKQAPPARRRITRSPNKTKKRERNRNPQTSNAKHTSPPRHPPAPRVGRDIRARRWIQKRKLAEKLRAGLRACKFSKTASGLFRREQPRRSLVLKASSCLSEWDTGVVGRGK